MKRAFPQKVKPVSCHPSAIDAEAGQFKQTPAVTTRRARTSAAMIGLAISMGASSLLLPRQNDGASAAEPIAAESIVAMVPLAFQVATLPSSVGSESADTHSASTAIVVEHVVQDGQTIWHLSRLYRVSVEAITIANNIPSASSLQVGETLRIPVSSSPTTANMPILPASELDRLQLAQQVDTATPVMAEQGQLSPLDADSGSNDRLKAERDRALDRLRQHRDKLRSSLAELETEDPLQSDGANPPKRTIAPLEPQVINIHTNPLAAHGTAESDAANPSSQATGLDGQDEAEVVAHHVKPGETLGAIALAYGVSQQELATANSLADPDWIRINQSLTIPQLQPSRFSDSALVSGDRLDELPVQTMLPTTSPQPTVIQPEVAEPSDSVVYRVHPGDTVSEIARLHDIPASSLASINRLGNPNVILVGQVLQIPSTNEERNLIQVGREPMAIASHELSSEPSASENISSPLVPHVSQSSLGVTTPMVPVATAESNTNSTTAIGSETVDEESETPSSHHVAVAPLSDATHPEAPDSSTLAGRHNPFVENLLADVISLRDRYRSGELTPPGTQPAVVAVVPTPLSSPSSSVTGATGVNPEFNPTRYQEAVEAQSPGMQRQFTVEPVQPQSRAGSAPSAVPATRPQVVAVAPLGSENYEPLLQPITGQMVSPDLPPLPGADDFLPDGPTRFNGYVWPARGVLTSGYGWRWGRMHRGIDIGAPVGTPVHAAAAGVVEFSGWNSGGYGNMVEIRHADGSMTRYAHHSRNLIRAGQRVEQGQQIAEVGSTGYSTGPHLHFEVHLPRQGTVNPIAYLPR